MVGVSAVIFLIALLALFLIGITVVKYAIVDTFVRTRLTMSALFCFIVATLSIAFWPSAPITLPFTVPAFGVGMLLGYFIGVRTARQKLMMQGAEHYMEHFAHIDPEDLKHLTWWSIINFYSIMCGLVLINLIGFTNIILRGSPAFIILTSSVGALFVGSIVPYLAHLWTVPLMRRQERARKRQNASNTTSE